MRNNMMICKEFLIWQNPREMINKFIFEIQFKFPKSKENTYAIRTIFFKYI